MNQQNAREYMPLVQALANGLTIQEDFFGKWCDTETPSFQMEAKYYRIKPKPRTFEIVRNNLTGSIYSADTYDGSDPNMWERITVTEVLE